MRVENMRAQDDRKSRKLCYSRRDNKLLSKLNFCFYFFFFIYVFFFTGFLASLRCVPRCGFLFIIHYGAFIYTNGIKTASELA